MPLVLEVELLVTGLVDQVPVDLAEVARQVEWIDGMGGVAEGAEYESELGKPIVDSK